MINRLARPRSTQCLIHNIIGIVIFHKIKMSFIGAVKKLKRKSRKSVWDIEAGSVAERIQERRERIRTRMEAAKRMQKLLSLKKSVGLFMDGEDGETRNHVEDAAERGAEHVYEIDSAGADNVTNVKISASHDFTKHNVSIRKRNVQLKKELEEEEEAMQTKFEEIMSKWKFDHKAGPTDLFEDIIAQKNLCGELLSSKNNIIDLLEDEHCLADEAYRDLIGEFNKNINVMSSRMETHQKAIEETFSMEIKNLEKGFEKQKSVMLKETDKTFKKGIENVAKKCKENLETRLGLVEEQEEEMTETINNSAAYLVETKMKMEACMRELEDEISMFNGLSFLNNERLDYEIHILGKHEDENSLIKSEQKRRITSLQDQANKLKMKVMEADKGTEKERINLIETIKNIKQQIKDLDLQQKKFGAQSAKRRTEMATMMKSEAFKILEKITKNDEILESFYLSSPFNVGQEGSETSSQTLATMGNIDKQRNSVKPSHKTKRSKIKQKSSTSSVGTESAESSKKEVDMKIILFTLIDKADFLVEEDLNEMMNLLPNKEKLLVKVDSILTNLGIKEASDLENIVKHLTKIGHKEGEKVDFESNSEKRSQVNTYSIFYAYDSCDSLYDSLYCYICSALKSVAGVCGGGGQGGADEEEAAGHGRDPEPLPVRGGHYPARQGGPALGRGEGRRGGVQQPGPGPAQGAAHPVQGRPRGQGGAHEEERDAQAAECRDETPAVKCQSMKKRSRDLALSVLMLNTQCVNFHLQ